MNNKIVVS